MVQATPIHTKFRKYASKAQAINAIVSERMHPTKTSKRSFDNMSITDIIDIIDMHDDTQNQTQEAPTMTETAPVAPVNAGIDINSIIQAAIQNALAQAGIVPTASAPVQTETVSSVPVQTETVCSGPVLKYPYPMGSLLATLANARYYDSASVFRPKNAEGRHQNMILIAKTDYVEYVSFKIDTQDGEILIKSRDIKTIDALQKLVSFNGYKFTESQKKDIVKTFTSIIPFETQADKATGKQFLR